MFIARFSNHIQEDIKRNWSSWNFGQDGLNCSKEQLELWKDEAITNNLPLSISGMELWGQEIEDADIRELYQNYWVLVDTFNGCSSTGIFGIELKAASLASAIAEAETVNYCGEGIRFDATEARLVKSIINEIHIFEI